MRTKALVAAICATVIFTFAEDVAAQTFPAKPIRVVVPYSPGGVPDVMARMVGQNLLESLGQQIVVDNRPGAAGVIAAELVMRAAPDGYTLLIADSSVYSINPSVQRKPPYDPRVDFTPVTLAGTAPLALTVNASQPIHSVKDLIALAKAKPGLLYGSSGTGTGHHLAMELLKSLAGIDLTHVPYKGGGQSVPAMVAGEVALVFAGLQLVLPHARAGKVRLLAVASGTRSPLQPDLPTMAEAGVPGFAMDVSIGFLAPAKTPHDIVSKLSAEINKVLGLPETRQRLAGLGIDAAGTTPEQFTEAIRSEIRQYSMLVKTTAIRGD